MPVSFKPYKPSTGTVSVVATSTGLVGDIAFGSPTRRPYHATPAFRLGLCAAYIHVTRPPQQKPVMPILSALPPLALAHATMASRSVITCWSGVLAMMFFIRSEIDGTVVGSPWRTNRSGASARYPSLA